MHKYFGKLNEIHLAVVVVWEAPSMGWNAANGFRFGFGFAFGLHVSNA